MPDPTKTRPFSVYLLKAAYDATNALSGESRLSPPVKASDIPKGSVLHVLDGAPREPWWRLYFGVADPLTQSTKGALLFVTAGKRTFAICFGNTAHNLENESYEYDFGLRVTLNCVDPDKLKNTDVSEPGAARRQRTQVAVGSDLTYFDFEGDSKVLRSLTGAVKPEFSDLLRNVTGSSNVRFTSPTRAQDIPALCGRLLDLYNRDDYKKSFPDVQNISPVRDPVVIDQLDDLLLASLRSKSTDPLLTVPELLDFNDTFVARFLGEGTSLLYSDVYLSLYYEHLNSRGVAVTGLTRDDLSRQKLELLTEDDQRRGIYPIYKCLVYDASLPGETAIYHLMEGNWYRFESDYVTRINNALAPLLRTSVMPPCTAHEEKDYNQAAALSTTNGICLDRTNFSPQGQTQLEPCDVLFEAGAVAVFAHVKMSTASADLSHLFNQGANAMELLRTNDDARDKLARLITAKAATGGVATRIQSLIDAGKSEVEYVIVTHKPASGGIENLPLFSRISLNRTARTFKAMAVGVHLAFVLDSAPDRKGVAKPRKPRARKGVAAAG
ncbi:MAG TPA: DUF6119 family protein [Pseudolysinimonas sp.]|jgi:uncharacterized protein (TIGR04141 family)